MHAGSSLQERVSYASCSGEAPFAPFVSDVAKNLTALHGVLAKQLRWSQLEGCAGTSFRCCPCGCRCCSGRRFLLLQKRRRGWLRTKLLREHLVDPGLGRRPPSLRLDATSPRCARGRRRNGVVKSLPCQPAAASAEARPGILVAPMAPESVTSQRPRRQWARPSMAHGRSGGIRRRRLRHRSRRRSSARPRSGVSRLSRRDTIA